jgi:hypothetical protein
LKAKKPAIEGFGTLMQDFRANEYVGKRVRFSAFVKSQDLESWAGLWMRVDQGEGATPQVLAFDNMVDAADQRYCGLDELCGRAGRS